MVRLDEIEARTGKRQQRKRPNPTGTIWKLAAVELLERETEEERKSKENRVVYQAIPFQISRTVVLRSTFSTSR